MNQYLKIETFALRLLGVKIAEMHMRRELRDEQNTLHTHHGKSSAAPSHGQLWNSMYTLSSNVLHLNLLYFKILTKVVCEVTWRPAGSRLVKTRLLLSEPAGQLAGWAGF